MLKIKIKDLLKNLFESICAGLFIIIGCTIYLSIKNNLIGALLFSIALFIICYRNYGLFTGKIGYLITKDIDILNILIVLLGNIIGVVIFGLIVSYCLPNISITSQQLIANKLDQTVFETFGRSIFCGILMFIAVDTFKKYKNPLVIFLCVSVFILCGFEHSIANIGYFIIAKKITFEYILNVILGNSIGSWIIPLLESVK